MAFHLDGIVPWGRNFDEYRRMFALETTDLAGRILDCGGGPACFVADAAAAGHDVVAADPLYAAPPDAIRARIDETADEVLRQVRANTGAYVWDRIPSPEALRSVRLGAMDRFLDDYAGPDRAGRYVAAALPRLPFGDGAFDLALVSHLLFTYSEHLDGAAHLAAVHELLRVARRVRIFPLVTLANDPSPHVDFLQDRLRGIGYDMRIREVDYRFQRDGNRMVEVATAWDSTN
ncbi:MAG: SAM-dependent methyltransferase [Planctomycetota bacterium]